MGLKGRLIVVEEHHHEMAGAVNIVAIEVNRCPDVRHSRCLAYPESHILILCRSCSSLRLSNMLARRRGRSMLFLDYLHWGTPRPRELVVRWT